MAGGLLRHRWRKPGLAGPTKTARRSACFGSCRGIPAALPPSKELETEIVERLTGHPDFYFRSDPSGDRADSRLIILAESRDLRRFGHVRQFLKFCGFDLCTEQSGQFRGTTYLSKRGNAGSDTHSGWPVRSPSACSKTAFAGSLKITCVLIRRTGIGDARRNAVAAKMARVVYAVITSGTDYRRFPEATRPGGRISLPRSVEASPTTS